MNQEKFLKIFHNSLSSIRLESDHLEKFKWHYTSIQINYMQLKSYQIILIIDRTELRIIQ